jgi:hypothetical protein
MSRYLLNSQRKEHLSLLGFFGGQGFVSRFFAFVAVY